MRTGLATGRSAESVPSNDEHQQQDHHHHQQDQHQQQRKQQGQFQYQFHSKDSGHAEPDSVAARQHHDSTYMTEDGLTASTTVSGSNYNYGSSSGSRHGYGANSNYSLDISDGISAKGEPRR